MGECIGLDFGTTYSVVARLKGVERDARGEVRKYDTIEAVNLGEGGNQTSTVDSIVAVSPRDKKYYGIAARMRTAQQNYHIYKGFKMLLSEKNDKEGLQRLKENGFSGVKEPYEVTKYFLESLIDAYRSRYLSRGETIDKLVVGVPEVWFNTSINSRGKLEEIAESIVGKGKVQLESEPKLACTYFVHTYKAQTGKDYSGYILLIDYGGGTLDIAVCQVENRGNRPEVSIVFKTGAGANEQKKLGNAGMAFLETVVNNTLIKNGVREEDIELSNSYYSCLHNVESLLLVSGDDVREVYEECAGDPDEIDEEFCTITYNAETYPVTYGTLSRSYNQAIEPVFREKLQEVKDKLDEKGIDYTNEQSDTFKIALVGGFCNFYLTQKQVEKTPGLGRGGLYDDRRYMDFDMYLADGSEREKAVAYGAALMANGVISSKTQAPYSLYLLPFRTVNGKKVPYEGEVFEVFNEYDEIEFDKPQIVRKIKIDEKTHKPCKDEKGRTQSVEVRFRADNIPFIKMTVGRDSFIGQPSRDLILPGQRTIKIGFSLDRNYILSLHVYDYGERGLNKKPQVTVQRLTNINDLLGGLAYTAEEG